MVFRSLVIFFLILHTTVLHAQEQLSYQIEAATYLSSEDNLPFWMQANRQGKVRKEDQAQLYLSLLYDFKEKPTDKLNFSAGADLLAFTESKQNKVEINALYAAVTYQKILLTAGSKQITEQYGGLSSSNGNIIFSGNARPIPGVWLETDGYWKVPFVGEKLSFKAAFGNGYLFDDRFVEDAQMHHKSLEFKWQLSEKSSLLFGVEDYAIWGGTSQELGPLPKDFSDFLRVVGGLSGSGDSPEGDAINALGNHIGAYRLEYQKQTQNFNLNLYWSHPFEDTSGRELNNIEDGLYGVFIDFKKPESVLSKLVFEFTYTKDQSGKGQIDGFDDFFNNTIYRSGYTFFGRTIGSPFFTPKEIDENGLTLGVQNNSFIAYHLGFSGKLRKHLYYKSLMSLSFNEGTKSLRFDESRTQFSSLLEIDYKPDAWPIFVSAGFGWDEGNLFDDTVGVYFKIVKTGFF
ncbi:MAG: capsule assembly Wzi family protein [Flavobacteriaceae bacterium]|nr:capsule assembly Wzi family protein [Flavobacteriaceae bacterium]